MEGRISHATRVLENIQDTPAALKKNASTVRRFADPNLQGIALLDVNQTGLVISGTAGRGIVLTRNKIGTWSSPSASDLQSTGLGLIGGHSRKDVVVFLYDEAAVKGMSVENGFFGIQAELTAGKSGSLRQAQTDIQGGNAVAVVLAAHGAFVGASLEVSHVEARSDLNAEFYHQPLSTTTILSSDVRLVPNDKESITRPLYKSLVDLCSVRQVGSPMEDLNDDQDTLQIPLVQWNHSLEDSSMTLE